MTSYMDLEKCVQANISAPSNDIRAKAEAHLKALKKKAPQQFFEGVSSLVQKSSDEEVRSFAAVLLKQNLGFMDETFFRIEPSSREKIKQLLLSRIKEEPSSNVTCQVAEAVSHLACLYVHRKNADWKELMPFLVSLSASPTPSERASFYVAIDKLACNTLDLLRASNMPKLRDLLEAGLQDKDDAVRGAALGAVVSLLCGFNEDRELNYFQKLVPLLFRNISTEKLKDRQIVATCECLQVLAENQPEFLVHAMGPIVACLVSVTSCAQLSWETRRLSLHLLLTLLDLHIEQMREEASEQGQARALEVAQQVIPLLFGFMQTVDDSLPWDAPEDDAEQAQLVFACEMMPITVSIFGAELFLAVVRPVFDAGFANEASWKQRFIALKTVEVTLEGCVEQYETRLQYVMQSTGASLQHSHKMVQYAALAVVKQLSVVLGEDKALFLEPYAELMNGFCGLLEAATADQKKPHRCVVVQVCDALAHFAYMDDENQVIHRYAGKVLRRLSTLLNCGDALVVSYALKASSVIISIIQEHFASLNVYAPLMQFCRETLTRLFQGQAQTLGPDHNGMLRGRIMECIGGMLLVMDVEQSRADAHAVMKFLLPFQKQQKENTASEAYSFMISLFASIAEALTAEFTPYLEHVIPPLIHSAQKQTVSIYKKQKDEQKQDAQPKESVVQQDFGGIRFQVNTAEVNEKSIAVQQFPRYAVCLEGALLQFVKPMYAACASIIKTRALSSEARRHAIEALVPLVNCLALGLASKGLPRDQVLKWCTQSVKDLGAALVRGMQLSDEVDEFSLQCKTLQELLSDDFIDAELFLKDAASKELIDDVTEQIATAVAERKVRRQLNEEKSIDLIDTDVEEDVEADLADTVCDLVERLVAIFGEKYVPIFEKHCGAQCAEFLAAEAYDTGYEEDQVLALSLLTEMVRHGGKAAFKFVQLMTPAAVHFLGHPANCSAQIRQAVCYALGVCAQKKLLRPEFAQKWLHLLRRVVAAEDARSEENADATENAISAMGKICQAYILPVGITTRPTENAIVEWMFMLPLLNDEEERQFCDEYLLSILQKTKLVQQMVQTKDAECMAKLVHIMAVAIVNGDPAKKQYLQLFAHLREQCDAGVVQHCVGRLDEEWREAFSSSQ